MSVFKKVIYLYTMCPELLLLIVLPVTEYDIITNSNPSNVFSFTENKLRLRDNTCEL